MTVVLVVAHPDDETIFFGGTIRRLVRAGMAVEVLCVTSTFATSTLTSVRRAEFRHACWALGARARLLPLTDRLGPLDEEELAAALERTGLKNCPLVFTHGAWGEYGHLHHIQVSRAVHRLVPRVWSLAGPFVTQTRHRLGPVALATKRALAADVYRSQPFAARWCTEEESFACWSRQTASYLCGLALGEQTLRPVDAALQATGGPFADVTHIPPTVWLDGHEVRCRRLGKG